MSENKKKFMVFCLMVFLLVVLSAVFVSCAKKTVKSDAALSSTSSAPAPMAQGTKMAKSSASRPSSDRVSGGADTGLIGSAMKPEAQLQEETSLSKDKKKSSEDKVSTWKRSEIQPNTLRLMIGETEELPIKGTQITVHVDGFRARVLMDIFFYNDRDRMFEGNFSLRLPDEASPYFLAFGESVIYEENMSQTPRFESSDAILKNGWSPEQIVADRKNTWKVLKQAKMVPREKAAIAYQETVRKKVDPALMEWSGPGIFSTRLYPIMPRKLHRVVIGYDTDLIKAGKDSEYRLDLPANIPNTVADILVSQMPGVSVSISPDNKGAKAGNRIHYRFEKPLERSLTVRLGNIGNILMTGKDAETDAYFAVKFKPDLPQAQISSGAPYAVFAVDVSLSSNPDRFNIWLALIQEILKNNRDELKQFAVLFFNIETFWWKEGFSANTPENLEALSAYIQTLALEGATDMGSALKEASQPSWADKAKLSDKWDIFLLSDGSATWGESDSNAISDALKSGHAASLFAYQTGLSGTDTRLLSNLARISGGSVFSVTGDAEVHTASTAHRNRPWQLVNVAVPGIKELLIAGRPESVFPGQELLIVGKGIPEKNRLVLTLARQGKEIRIPITLPDPVASDLTPRIYGQVAVGQMEEFKETVQAEPEAYSRHFRITGQTCSLLMLESEADYQRFNIKPQDDALVVKITNASEVISKQIKNIGENAAHAKVRFMSALEKLKKVPLMNFNLSIAFQMTLDKMPEESFAVQPKALNCKARTWKEMSGLIREQLATGKPDYDSMSLEAEHRKSKYGNDDALKALSSLIELNPNDPALCRDIAFTAMEMGFASHAYHLLRRVAEIRPHEFVLYREMALCLTEIGKADLAMAYYEVASDSNWSGRAGEFAAILNMDYLRLLKMIDRGRLTTSVKDFAEARLKKIAEKPDAKPPAIVVVATWNTDKTDIDLHVVEPNGEECYYGHRFTKKGGHITRDVTDGYGPEMYMSSQSAESGTYKVTVQYFRGDQNRASTRSKVYVSIYQFWGTPNEKLISKSVALTGQKQQIGIAEIELESSFLDLFKNHF